MYYFKKVEQVKKRFFLMDDLLTAQVIFKNYRESVSELLEKLDLSKVLDEEKPIVIKPNLLDNAPHPCTTDPGCVDAIIKYLRKLNSSSKIIILEGSGGCSTKEAYRDLGYYKMAEENNIEIYDVDDCSLIRLTNDNAIVYKEIFLPEIIFNSFFISVPVLKDHLITTVTLGMKNLVGLLPEKHYGKYWSYKRSDVHRVGVNNAIVDLNQYVKTDLVVIDGRIGQFGSHMAGGRRCDPPKSIILGGYDVLEVDKKGSELLGHEWSNIKHLKLFSDIKF